MMTAEQIQGRIAELQKKRDVLETEARQHEQAARDKRAERDKVKLDLSELSTTLTNVVQMNAAQQAVAAAQQAQKHAETSAAAGQQELKALQDMRAETEKLSALLKEQLAALAANTPA